MGRIDFGGSFNAEARQVLRRQLVTVQDTGTSVGSRVVPRDPTDGNTAAPQPSRLSLV